MVPGCKVEVPQSKPDGRHHPPRGRLLGDEEPGGFCWFAKLLTYGRIMDTESVNVTVVGLQWGDEGKGKVVDALSGACKYVVRFCGGANAGHTVRVGEEKYALHLIPCGVLRPDVINVIGNGVVFDPTVAWQEIEHLRERGVEIGAGNLLDQRSRPGRHALAQARGHRLGELAGRRQDRHDGPRHRPVLRRQGQAVDGHPRGRPARRGRPGREDPPHRRDEEQDLRSPLRVRPDGRRRDHRRVSRTSAESSRR